MRKWIFCHSSYPEKGLGGRFVRDKTTFSFSLYSLVMFKVKNPQMTLSDSTMAGSISTRNVRMKCIALRKCSANLFFFLRTNVISNVYKFCYSKKLLIRKKKGAKESIWGHQMIRVIIWYQKIGCHKKKRIKTNRKKRILKILI